MLKSDKRFVIFVSMFKTKFKTYFLKIVYIFPNNLSSLNESRRGWD